MDTVCDLVEYLIGKSWRKPDKKFLAWAPDAFAVAATILRETGSYVGLTTEEWPPVYGKGKTVRRNRANIYSRNIRKIGHDQWWGKLYLDEIPLEVLSWWMTVWNLRGTKLNDVNGTKDLWQALVQICTAADEACLYIGEPYSLVTIKDTKSASLIVKATLNLYGEAASLCNEIGSRKAIVLPKMSVPKGGLTLRSLTHHLALLPPSEVSPKWGLITLEPKRLLNGINIIIFPWPKVVHPAQFSPASLEPIYERDNKDHDEKFGFFSYQPRTIPDVDLDDVEAALKKANEEIGIIHAVVFPEMALDDESWKKIKDRLRGKVDFVVAGYYSSGIKNEPAQNSARVWVRLKSGNDYFETEFKQHKHHRWFLDNRQIRQYGLGANLNPNRVWWEYIGLNNRELHFFSLGEGLLMTILICEDLARPDPVADIIRAVGPSLVISLLQDGPQLLSRWPARYASVLSDDPGCSVLTVTGLGMTQLSRALDNDKRSPSRVVALWKQDDGETREVELPQNCDAVVLCLSKKWEYQWTSDGRHDNRTTGKLVLSGVHPINVKKP